MVYKRVLFAMIFVFKISLVYYSNGLRISNRNPINAHQATTYDPDADLTPPKIIRSYGYPSEAHVVQSADGYLLEMHRIPYGKRESRAKNPYPILLHHGLLSNSIDWILTGPQKSLAYRLADAGYDVWMANARGSTYSRSHVSISPNEKEFWNFSFHELGYYDAPAQIDYILARTGAQQIVYIGHSQGTTVFYVMASTRPEYNSKIKLQISLAPVAALPHTTSAFRYLIPLAKKYFDLNEWYSKGAFLKHTRLSYYLSNVFCRIAILRYNFCERLIYFKIYGKDVEQFDESLLPIIWNNVPAGTSAKNILHSAQSITTGNFSQYDYGEEENIKRYNSTIPPSYDLSLISAPVAFYYAHNDLIADPLDVQNLYQKLPNPMGLKLISYDKFNHIDYLWAKELNRLLNDELVQFIENSTNVRDSDEFIRKSVAVALKIREKTLPPVGNLNVLNNINEVPDSSFDHEYVNKPQKNVIFHAQTMEKEIILATNKAEDEMRQVIIQNLKTIVKSTGKGHKTSRIRVETILKTIAMSSTEYRKSEE